jgi:hypothetical protein
MAFDPQLERIFDSAPITTNGSYTFRGVFPREVIVLINIKAPPTGTAPTLTFSIQDVDPMDESTPIGGAVSTAPLDSVGLTMLQLTRSCSTTVQVSWLIGGVAPSFPDVDVCILTKNTTRQTLVDGADIEVGTAANPLTVRDATSGTLNNGQQTPVSSSAVSILASNANRKAAIIQNVGEGDVRIGTSGVSATTGIRLTAGSTLIFESPYIVTSQLFAIRDGLLDSTVFAAEIT